MAKVISYKNFIVLSSLSLHAADHNTHDWNVHCPRDSVYDRQGGFVAGLGPYVPHLSLEQEQLMRTELERNQNQIADQQRQLEEYRKIFADQQREIEQLRHGGPQRLPLPQSVIGLHVAAAAPSSSKTTVFSQVAPAASSGVASSSSQPVPSSRPSSETILRRSTADATSSPAALLALALSGKGRGIPTASTTNAQSDQRTEGAFEQAMLERRRVGAEREHQEASNESDKLDAEINRLVSQRNAVSATFHKILEHTKRMTERLRKYDEDAIQSFISFSALKQKLLDDSASLLQENFQRQHDEFQKQLIVQEEKTKQEYVAKIRVLLTNPQLSAERRTYFTELLQPHLGEFDGSSLPESLTHDGAAAAASGAPTIIPIPLPRQRGAASAVLAAPVSANSRSSFIPLPRSKTNPEQS